MSQALVDELTRIALAKTDELRSKLLDMVGRLGKEEAAFQICWRTYQWPTGTLEDSLEEFAERVSLERLLTITRKHGLKDAVEAAVGVAKTIPKFNPHGGFATFGAFLEKLLEAAEASGGSLVSYLSKFRSAKDLEDWLKNLPGLGQILAPGLVRDLRLADIIKLDIAGVSVSASDPVMRVLVRSRLVPNSNPKEAEKVVRGLFKVPPMLLDAGLWHIGFHYCREEPECDICPIAYLCAKRDVK